MSCCFSCYRRSQKPTLLRFLGERYTPSPLLSEQGFGNWFFSPHTHKHLARLASLISATLIRRSGFFSPLFYLCNSEHLWLKSCFHSLQTYVCQLLKKMQKCQPMSQTDNCINSLNPSTHRCLELWFRSWTKLTSGALKITRSALTGFQKDSSNKQPNWAWIRN